MERGRPNSKIFRKAFEAADLPYAKPHSFGDTIVRVGQRICRTPEEWKVYSQNLRYESEATTRVGYGEVPAHWQAEIMRGFHQGPAQHSASWIGLRRPEGLCSERSRFLTLREFDDGASGAMRSEPGSLCRDGMELTNRCDDAIVK
jgi:hypothetical protein